MTRSRLILFAGLVGVLLFLLTAVSHQSAAFQGPLEIRNQFPLFIHLNSPGLESASQQDRFSLVCSYSSLFLLKRSNDWSVQMDMETLEFAFRIKKNIPQVMEIGLEIPLLSFNSGVLDDPLQWYHQTFGFPDYGRSTRPKNDYLYRVGKGGKTVVEGELGKLGLGDIRITGKKELFRMDGHPFLSLKLDLEIPTGDPQKGYGNGSLDIGLGLLLEKEITQSLLAVVNGGLVVPGPWKAKETIALREYYYGGLGVEWAFSKRLSFLSQVWAQTSPFPETGIDSIDRPALIFSIGSRYAYGPNSLELALTEDLNTSGAPDFTVTFSLKRQF